MKTPLDGAVRLTQRELDDAQRALGAERARLNDIDRQLASQRERDLREAAIASSDWTLPSHRFRQLARAQAAQLIADRSESERQVERLRDAACATFAELQAIETAVERHREEARVGEQRASQNAADEFALNAFLRAKSAADTRDDWR